jgi:transcription elongation factor GreA
MATEKFYVTQEGYNELVSEQENLIHKVRQEVIVELQEARAQGDLSENADYDAARERQAQVEGRIRELEAMIKNAEIITESDGKKKASKKAVVKLGSKVTIEDLSDNTQSVFTIVGTIEADPFNGKLSNTTPLAEVIMDKKVGDVVTVTRVEQPYDVKILEIK